MHAKLVSPGSGNNDGILGNCFSGTTPSESCIMGGYSPWSDCFMIGSIPVGNCTSRGTSPM